MNENEAQLKLLRFCNNPKPENLLTREEFDKLNPFAKGYATYMQSAWDESELTDENPYPEGTGSHETFNQGSRAAMIDTQDMEE